MTTRENERRDSGILIILILLLGFFCIILASGWAIRFAPSWRLNTNMGSNLDPNKDFLTSRPVSFIEPLDPAILTNPAWLNVFLTPGASLPTRTPSPAGISTNIPPKTSTPISTIPATNTPTVIASPTNTQIFFPPATSTPRPISTNTPVTPLPSADLQITKTDGVTTYNPGGTLTYTITVTNNGASPVTGAVVTDNIPAQITTWTWVCASQTGGATGCNGVAGSNANFTDTVNLPNGASIVYTVTANISAAATGNLINTATVTVPAGYTDPSPGNNSATDTNTPIFVSDLGITKTDGVVTYVPGNTLSYTITFTNNGPNAITGAVIVDNIPAQITTWDWACTAQNGGATGCDAVTGSNANFTDTVNLPNGASIVYTVTANVSAAATGNLVNTATVSVPVGYLDPTPGNNSATDTDTQFIPTPVDLQITKTDGVATYTAGLPLTYTVTVTNNGPNAVTGAVVTDNLPAQITAWNWACTSQTGGATGCDAVAGSNTNFTDTVNLPNGASIVYTVTANVSAGATGNLINTATVGVPAGYTDPTPGNNSATDTNTPVFVANLGITKTDNATDYAAGFSVQYTIVVSNAGPSNANGASVSDAFSTNLNSITWTCVGSGGASCTANGIGDINDTTVNLPAGSSVTYTVNATVIAAPVGNLVNTATVGVPAGITDPVPGNNSATDTDTLIIPNPFPYGNIDPVKNGSIEMIPTNTVITMQFGTPLIVGGHAGYDLVYYELPQGANPGVLMDRVQLQIGDGRNWYTIFNWGDGFADTNTNLPVPLGPPNPTNCAGEPDNCEIDASLMYDLSGVSIELDGVVPNGTYYYIRIISPAAPLLDSGDGVEVDAILILP